MVIVCVVLTLIFGTKDLDNSVVKFVFGYNNICVYWDYPPSAYIAPIFYSFIMSIFLSWHIAFWLRLRSQASNGGISLWLFRLLTGMKVFEVIVLLCFSLTLAVDPEDEEGHDNKVDEKVYIHVFPFIGLQLGLVSMAISSTIHGVQTGYWENMGFGKWTVRGVIVYCVIFALIVGYKIPTSINYMLEGRWFERTEALGRLSHGVDVLFLLFAGVAPMLKTMYLLYYKRNQLSVIVIDLATVSKEATERYRKTNRATNDSLGAQGTELRDTIDIELKAP
ncbi:hypothetical protein AAMO2058_000478200 [Amorphochlora amoebiformis]